jgi:hypothetical protein
MTVFAYIALVSRRAGLPASRASPTRKLGDEVIVVCPGRRAPVRDLLFEQFHRSAQVGRVSTAGDTLVTRVAARCLAGTGLSGVAVIELCVNA